jgi:hypothetical protein
MSRFLILMATLSLAACAGAPREPLVVTQLVKVPVMVSCSVKEPAVQSYAADKVSLEANLFELTRALLMDRDERIATEIELRAAVRTCTE